MMKFTVSTWNGNDISSTTYDSRLTIESGADNFGAVDVLMAENVSGRPTYQGRVLQERRIKLWVQINNKTQANYEQLMKWFDPALGECDLVCTADDATTRTLTAKVESRKSVQGADWLWEFSLVAADGRWKQAATQVAWTVNASAATQAVVNDGTTRTFPRIKVKAAVAKTAANGWTYRRFLQMANRASAPLVSPMGALGYPILLTGAAIDFTGKAVAGYEDIRVFVDGKEWQRYFAGTIGAQLIWIPVPYSPALTARFGSTVPNNSTTIASQLMTASIANWPASGYILADSEVLFYESHDDYYLYNVHRAMFNSTVSAHITSVPRYVQEHIVELWYNFSGVTADSDLPYEIDDIALPGLDAVNSTNVAHEWTSFWQRTKRYSRQWMPELREVNAFDQFISLEDTAASMEFRDTPGRFKKNAMVMDCPVPIATSAGAVEHDITVPVTLCLKCIGQDVAGNDIELTTYYKPDSGTNVTLTPSAQLTQFRYEVHNQIVTGGVGTGTDTLVTSSAPYAQTLTLDEATTVRALFYRHKRASGSDTLTLDLYAVNDDDTESVDTSTKLMPSASPGSYNTSYVDETEQLSTPINLAAGKYALVWTCSGSTGVNIDSSDGSTYSGGEMRSGGVQLWTVNCDYDVEYTSGAKSTADPLDLLNGASAVAFRFPDTAFPNNPTISALTLRIYVEGVAGAGNVISSDFGGDGAYDINGATAAALWAADGVNVYLAAPVAISATGLNDLTLNATAMTDIITAMADSSYFALGLEASGAVNIDISPIADASNPEAKLIMNYTDPTDAAYTTVVGRDAYFLVLGDAENAPQADAPAGQALEVIIDNVGFDYVSGSAPSLVNATEETTGVVMLYNAVLTNQTTGQTITVKIPCTVGDEFEIDCEAKTIKRTIIGGSGKNNGIVGDHIPWCCEFSDDEEWMRLDPGSNTLRWDETGMATNGVVITVDYDDTWS